ncbi:SPFH domain-containing protein [Pseudomonas sp. NUPR-001]|uniref:SPFH domain-containing protein n=1 Tax=Pseudomonas sp. NUPR-001 TaxID=3416058 RepID=UPI003F9C4C1C
MNDLIAPFFIGIVVVVVLLVGSLVMFKAFYRKVDQGIALIVNDLSSHPKVHFTGAMVYPIIYRAEEMPLRLVPIELSRRANEGLICQDNLRADIDVVFYVRVNESADDVLKVAKAVGVQRASDPRAIRELFQAKFSEALKSVGRQHDLLDLFQNRLKFRDDIVTAIGKDLNGYALEDVAIDHLEQTPREHLDPNNIIDAQGIKTIVELTSAQNINTNEIERTRDLKIKEQNVDSKEKELELDRRQAEAQAKSKQEIAELQARAESASAIVVQETRLATRQAEVDTDTKIQVAEEGQTREVELASASRRAAVVVVEEGVNKARLLAEVESKREVQSRQIDADGEVEKKKTEIAEVVRERIAIDKTVAIEEEAINEVREVSAADRLRQVRVIEAEAKAQESKVSTVAMAEAEAESAEYRARAVTTTAEAKAQESKVATVAIAKAEAESAEHLARAVTTTAEAELDAAQKGAEAKKAIAQGVEAEAAAPGLAEAKVRVASAEAIKAVGTAEAEVTELRMASEARGRTALGEANAAATKAEGLAESAVIESRYTAEAKGLTEKFQALNSLSQEARAHEEFRMELQSTQEQVLAQVAVSKDIAQESAAVLAAALEGAKVEIIGGSATNVSEQLAAGLGIGKLFDGMGRSPIVQGAIGALASRGAATKPPVAPRSEPKAAS